MDITVSITVPSLIYDLYRQVGKELGNRSPEQAMTSALIAYMQHMIDEMRADGTLQD